MMKSLLVKTILFLLLLTVGLTAADVELVGSIEEGLYGPTSLEVSSDGIAVLEPFSSQLKLFTPEGQIKFKLDLSGEAQGLTRISLYQYLYCDRGKREVIKVDLSTGAQTEFIVDGSSLTEPTDLVFYDNSLYLLDGGASKIIRYSATGLSESQFSLLDDSGSPLKYASSFDYLPALDRFYVLEQTSSRIFVYDSNGSYLFSFGSFGNKEGEITRGGELKIDQYSRVFVSDRFQGRVLSFDAVGNFLTNIDAADSTVSMAIPTGLDVDENGLIYVASTMSAKIHIFYSSLFSSSEAMVAQQFYPADSATVMSDELNLIVFAESNNDLLVPTHFEYELYQWTETEPLLVATQNVLPLEDNSQLPDRPGMSATWTLASELEKDQSYRWRTRVVWATNASEWSAWRTFVMLSLPVEFVLNQNYPNPFNPTTHITFTLPVGAQTRLEIFNLLGAKVTVLIDEYLEAGHYESYKWDGRNQDGRRVGSGVYFYRLLSGEQKQTRKMVLIK